MMADDPQGALASLLGSVTRARVLEHLFEHHADSFGIRETAALAGGLDYRMTRRELRRLEDVGVVRTVGEGRTRTYAVEPGHPAHADLRGPVLKTGSHGSVRSLREEPARHDWIVAAAVFGSLASGRERAESEHGLRDRVETSGADAGIVSPRRDARPCRRRRTGLSPDVPHDPPACRRLMDHNML
jgi:DNA-binding transcriptional ArsR family regulator